MTMKIRTASAALFLFLFSNSFVRSQTTFPYPGLWQGSIKVGEMSLRLVVKITADSSGNLRATMDSPDQGAKNIPIDSVQTSGNVLRLILRKMSARFEGTIRNDSAVIGGEWHQGGRSFPLTLRKVEKISEVNRPQEPKRPYPYKEEEVRVENKPAGVTLAGTLTTPSAGGPFTAVVLITGSGAQDRDEALLGHKPFLIIADYLTRCGIAVLRMDDRGVGKSTGVFSTATTIDFVSDMRAAVEFLKKRQDIDRRKIGLIGHSEGALIAPLLASQASDVAFVVMLAGPGVNGEEIMMKQGELISRANGEPDSAIQNSLVLQKRIFSIVKQETDTAAARRKLSIVLKEAVQARSDEEKKKNPVTDADIEAQLSRVNSPWFRFFLTYDPRPALTKVQCPVLVLIGQKDLQVSPGQNLPPIEAALKEGKNKKYVIQELPGLNHLFQSCETGSPMEYQKIEETFSPKALEVIMNWVSKQ